MSYSPTYSNHAAIHASILANNIAINNSRHQSGSLNTAWVIHYNEKGERLATRKYKTFLGSEMAYDALPLLLSIIIILLILPMFEFCKYVINRKAYTPDTSSRYFSDVSIGAVCFLLVVFLGIVLASFMYRLF